jgi:translation initiation factor eIF-2B subunit epsilon
MSHKGKNSASSAKGKKPAKGGAESKTEEVLQAVVLADSFQDRFRPFTVEKPRVRLIEPPQRERRSRRQPG